jgi:hypothetical protein
MEESERKLTSLNLDLVHELLMSIKVLFLGGYKHNVCFGP